MTYRIPSVKDYMEILSGGTYSSIEFSLAVDIGDRAQNRQRILIVQRLNLRRTNRQH